MTWQWVKTAQLPTIHVVPERKQQESKKLTFPSCRWLSSNLQVHVARVTLASMSKWVVANEFEDCRKKFWRSQSN